MRLSFAVGLLACGVSCAQDPGTALNEFLTKETGQRFKLTFEFRAREETRDGNNFGRAVDLQNPLFRTRIGAEFRATDWLKFSAMGQDARAPQYGGAAPVSARDTMDLHEAYFELFPDHKGFGAIGGRQSFNLGEGRLIGVPQWRNTSRTYDTARVYYRSDWARIEFLFVSLVDVKPDEFNRPRLGDQLWGMYNTLPRLLPKSTVDLYILRRDENFPGGFTLPGTLGVTTYGGRAAGELPVWGMKYSTEEAVQTGHTGLKEHRGFGAFVNLSRQSGPLTVSIEYKYASGDDGSHPGRETTFDQLYAANHDKFGHADLFGWRNMHDLRSLETLQVHKRLAINFMYDNWWLASATDSLYDGQGRSIVRSANGSAGRYVGQEFDLFSVFRAGHGLQLGAGVAKVVAGEFLKKTTPHPNTTYFYVFQTYSF